jgi:uncharacterized protein (UPF0261 family)
MNPSHSESPIEFLIPEEGVLAQYNNGKDQLLKVNK